MHVRTNSLCATFAAIALAVSPGAGAQPLFDEATDMTCATFLAPLLGKKQIAQLAADRSIEVPVICSCAKTKVHSDVRLARLSSLDKAEIETRMRDDPKLLSYTVGRIMHSVIACFNTELDATLDASQALR